MNAPLLNRYVLTEIMPGFLVNILVFTSILLMGQVMVMANLVITRGVGLGIIGANLLLAMPKVLSMTLPMATLLAVLTAFLRFSADSELTVLRASGISLYQLSPPVLVFAFLAASLTGVFSLWLAPESNWRLKNQLLALAKARADLAIQEQTFVRSFSGLVLYVGQMPPGTDKMGQVFIYDSRSQEETSVIVAQSGRLGLDQEAGVLLFHLEDGVIDRVYDGKPSTNSVFFETYELKVSPGDEFGNDEGALGIARDRGELPTGELLKASQDILNQGLGAASALGDLVNWYKAKSVIYELEWHRRLALPVTTFIMALVGLPLGASFRVRGRNFALLMGLGVFIVYYTIFSLGWSLAENGRIPPAIGVWASNIFLSVLGMGLLRRINRGAAIDPIELMRRLGNWLKPSKKPVGAHL